MLTLSHVTIGYKQNIVIKDMNLSLEEDKIYALVGKSGSGKSTLIKAIASILPYSGDILLNDVPLDRRKHHIALVPQNNSLVRWKTVAYNIAFPQKIRKTFDAKEMKKICDELGITPLLDKYPNHISGGEVQRVAIARAFLSQPNLLLMDEPFSALDTITRTEVHALFLETYRRHKITTLMITHDIEEALYLAETILLLRNGEIAEMIDNPYFGKNKDDLGADYVAMKKRLVAAI